MATISSLQAITYLQNGHTRLDIEGLFSKGPKVKHELSTVDLLIQRVRLLWIPVLLREGSLEPKVAYLNLKSANKTFTMPSGVGLFETEPVAHLTPGQVAAKINLYLLESKDRLRTSMNYQLCGFFGLSSEELITLVPKVAFFPSILYLFNFILKNSQLKEKVRFSLSDFFVSEAEYGSLERALRIVEERFNQVKVAVDHQVENVAFRSHIYHVMELLKQKMIEAIRRDYPVITRMKRLDAIEAERLALSMFFPRLSHEDLRAWTLLRSTESSQAVLFKMLEVDERVSAEEIGTKFATKMKKIVVHIERSSHRDLDDDYNPSLSVGIIARVILTTAFKNCNDRIRESIPATAPTASEPMAAAGAAGAAASDEPETNRLLKGYPVSYLEKVTTLPLMANRELIRAKRERARAILNELLDLGAATTIENILSVSKRKKIDFHPDHAVNETDAKNRAEAFKCLMMLLEFVKTHKDL